MFSYIFARFPTYDPLLGLFWVLLWSRNFARCRSRGAVAFAALFCSRSVEFIGALEAPWAPSSGGKNQPGQLLSSDTFVFEPRQVRGLI